MLTWEFLNSKKLLSQYMKTDLYAIRTTGKRFQKSVATKEDLILYMIL